MIELIPFKPEFFEPDIETEIIDPVDFGPLEGRVVVDIINDDLGRPGRVFFDPKTNTHSFEPLERVFLDISHDDCGRPSRVYYNPRTGFHEYEPI